MTTSVYLCIDDFLCVDDHFCIDDRLCIDDNSCIDDRFCIDDHLRLYTQLDFTLIFTSQNLKKLRSRHI